MLLLSQCLMTAACATVVGTDNKVMIDLKKVDMIRYTQDLKSCRDSIKNSSPIAAFDIEPKAARNTEPKTETVIEAPTLVQAPGPVSHAGINPVINCLLKRGYTLLE